MARRRQKEVLIGHFHSATSTMGRIEVEGPWQKDPTRAIRILIGPNDLPALESAISAFKRYEGLTEPLMTPAEKKGAAESASAATVRRERRAFKTIGDVTHG